MNLKCMIMDKSFFFELDNLIDKFHYSTKKRHQDKH